MSEITLRSYARATQTSVASATSSTTLIAANGARKGLIIANTSTAVLYILFGGGTATATTAHSVQMAANTSYSIEGFTGAVTGIWASVNGQANITEFE